MPGETKTDVSGWTVDTLRASILSILDERDRRYEQRFESQQAATRAAMVSAQMAVAKAEQAVEKRLENTNEWRAAMNDRDLRLMPRTEVEALVKGINQDSNTRFNTNADKITALDKRMDRAEGRGAGLHAGWGYVVGGIGVISSVVAIIMMLLRHWT